MRSTRRLLEISFLMMAVLSGLLLSTSLGSPSYLLVGGLGALGGLILVDWTGWIRMPTFVANLLSFVVLYLSMRGFFANETSGQLGSVANLLVYLQTLLVLQDKGPRQYWQLMVLSFLQLVVASVFHVQLEGGVLFLAYMATSAIFLVLLNSYSQTWTSYSRDVRKVTSGIPASRSAKYFASSAPEVVSEIRPNRMVAISNMLRHVTSWIMACLAFASVLFILIPRSDVTWFTGRTGQTIMAGSSKGVNLDERGRIELSYSSIMKAQFRRSRRGDGIQLDSPAYFRTMAMNTLVVENGNSTWKAPYDRVYNWQPIARPPYQGRCVMVHVAHEPTLDPALSTVDPVFDDAESPIFGYYSNDLSLIARSDVDTEIEMIPFHYQFWVPLLPNTNTLPDSFPYLYLDRLNSTITMRENPAEFKSLTSIDRTRYSGIIAIGDQLVQELGSANDLLIAKKAGKLVPRHGTVSVHAGLHQRAPSGRAGFHRGFCRQPSPGTLRNVRLRTGSNVAKPGDPRPDGNRLLWRFLHCGSKNLPDYRRTRSCLGRSLHRSRILHRTNVQDPVCVIWRRVGATGCDSAVRFAGPVCQWK